MPKPREHRPPPQHLAGRPRNTLTPRVLTVADIFCGAGGLSAGFNRATAEGASTEVRFGVDIDRDSIATYRRSIFGRYSTAERERRAPCRSVVGLSAAMIRETCDGPVDVLIGGPNCQAVSAGGLRNHDDRRNEMFYEFVRLVEELRPRWFVMENVPGLVYVDASQLFRDVLRVLTAIDGYQVAADVVTAVAFGVAQHRYRLFIIGTRTGLPITFPATNTRTVPTVRDAIGDLSSRVPGSALTPVIPNHAAHVPTPITLARIGAVPAGGDWRDMPLRLLPDRFYETRTSDQKGSYGRLEWRMPAFTITGLAGNASAGRFIHPSQDRALSPREAARLQGFEDSHVFVGSVESTYRQIGNAVPPPVARAIAETILRVEQLGHSDGTMPRLTLELLEKTTQRRAKLPVLTPRVNRDRATHRPIAPATPAASTRTASARRDMSAETLRLKSEASLPANMWTSKRARALIASAGGASDAEIARRLNLSVRTIGRWVSRYRTLGLDGWRAYHTPIEVIARGDGALLNRLRKAVQEVRQPSVAPGESARRPHMNVYLRQLIDRYGHLSINVLMAQLRDRGVHVGTAYVADLLAIADTIVKRSDAADDPRDAVVVREG